MRKIESSGNTDNAMRLSSRAEARSSSERFFDDDARLIGQTRRAEPFDHRGEQRGRDGEVMRRAPGIAQRLLERLERFRVVVIAAHISEQGKQVLEGVAVIDPAGLPDAVRRLFAQLRQAPLRGGDAHHRHVENAAPGHRVERRKNHLVREIAGHAEDHQRIRLHRVPIDMVHPNLLVGLALPDRVP